VIVALRGETNSAFSSRAKGVVFSAVSVVIQPRAIVEVDELVAGPKIG
jgi:hypothetical protein